MSALQSALSDYLDNLTGVRHALTPEPANSLPLFLRSRFAIFSVKIFGRRQLLALEEEHAGDDSPGRYEQQSDLLRAKLGEPVVLVIRRLPSFARNRLVRLGVPFIVPGSQMFLPSVLVDLRERFHEGKSPRSGHLTPAAQCVILYHLVRLPLEGMPLRAIAEKVGYAPIMLSKVKDELVGADIAEVVRDGRALSLHFKAQGRTLWNLAVPHLASPVKKTLWGRWHHSPDQTALPAGLTALSAATDISDDRLPSYAMSAADLRHALERGDFHALPGPEEAEIRLEGWSYDPALLGEARRVDPLSLYLSLRHSPDERVRQQLETLLDRTLPW